MRWTLWSFRDGPQDAVMAGLLGSCCAEQPILGWWKPMALLAGDCGTGESACNGWYRCCSVSTHEWSFRVDRMVVPERWPQTGLPSHTWNSTAIHLTSWWSFTPLFENNNIWFMWFTPKERHVYIPFSSIFLWLGERKSCKDHRLSSKLSTWKMLEKYVRDWYCIYSWYLLKKSSLGFGILVILLSPRQEFWGNKTVV